MRVISKKEFIGLDTENVMAVAINNHEILALADVETWEECPYDDDRYRIEIYETDRLGQQWFLDKEIVAEDGLFEALLEERGFMCGGISFMHEEDREEKNVYEDLLDMLHSQYGEFNMYAILKSEEASVLKDLTDGIYVFVIE